MGFDFEAVNGLGDAARHQVLELRLVPGVEEVGVHGGVRSPVVRGERRLPRVVGMGNWKFVWSIGTGYGWVLGHFLNRLRLNGVDHVRAVVVGRGCASGVEQRLPVLASTARQSGNLMRTTNLPLEHCFGGVVDQVPFWHLHSTFLPCTVTIFSPGGWGFTSMMGRLATQLVVEECLGSLEGVSGATGVGPGDSRDPVGRCVSKRFVSRRWFQPRARGALLGGRGRKLSKVELESVVVLPKKSCTWEATGSGVPGSPKATIGSTCFCG